MNEEKFTNSTLPEENLTSEQSAIDNANENDLISTISQVVPLNQENNLSVNDSQVPTNVDSTILFANKPPVTYCKHCGSVIPENYPYCNSCGVCVTDENIRFCTKCGARIELNQRFCSGCGAATQLSKSNVKKKQNIKIAIIVTSLLLFVAVLIGVGTYTLPKIFVSTETLLSQADYEKAYQKAKDSEKEGVLWENIVATICADFKEQLKNPDSFKLLNVWIDEENDNVFIEYNATNGYGGTIKGWAYYYWSSSTNYYQLFDAVQDFDEEEYRSYDDYWDKIEKNIANSAKKTIKKAISNDDLLVTNGMVERINTINEQGLLESITLIDETKSIEHEDDSDDSDDM